MKRRKFIYTAGTALSIPMLLKGMNVAAMPSSPLFNAMNMESDRVLVLVQLNGGNDGLNTIIPKDQYANLMNVRANVMLPENTILNATDTVGFHPNMGGLKNLFDEGKLGVVQSVGYPNQNRSHFRSKDIWSSASPANEFWNTGWMGRQFDEDYPGFPEGYPNEMQPDPIAITIGNSVSETCQGMGANYSLTLKDPFSLSPLSESGAENVPDTPYGEELTFLRTTIAQTNAYSEVVIGAAEAGANMVDYPADSKLATALKNVALLISGGLQTKIYIVDIGGFDTHANQVIQGDTTTGKHAELLKDLSDSIAAFQQDLIAQGLEQRVVGMTFSEFGRRIKSNDSLGTDHGTAAPLILFGACVNPQILGDNPQIGAEVANNEGVPMQYDFRDVYGSVLKDWFEVAEEDVRNIIHQEFQALPILDVCESTTTSTDDFYNPIEVKAFPNPFRSGTQITFNTSGEYVRLSIYDTLGQELKVLVNNKLPAGEHQINFNANGLASGSYFFRLQLDGRQKTERIIKL